MVLRNASKSLSENDFRRVVPKGRHIEGWKGQGDIMKGTSSIDKGGLQCWGNTDATFLSDTRA